MIGVFGLTPCGGLKVPAGRENLVAAAGDDGAPQSGVRIEPVVEVAGLSTGTSHPAVTFVKALVQRNDHARVDYCTEAGLFSTRGGIVSVVCGPRSMQQGHKPDEFLSLPQIEKMLANGRQPH
ncbi:hypothetical protein [Mesorhizobium sp. CO1-1-8]|uniref:hypothetical protein n=1 Tax=Mesorhizobium sp. CO1-1-8 TaxID=2876631 RepID=UPI001CD0929F|nr:hypothetical protein [Mesorhizobium sp. CO1-1-8]MBZ9772264.1 hypothetical protein [Mesorhizobium sp. CO1-1-8]